MPRGSSRSRSRSKSKDRDGSESPTTAIPPHPPLMQPMSTPSRKFRHATFDPKMSQRDRRKRREAQLKAAMELVEWEQRERDAEVDKMKQKMAEHKKNRDEMVKLEQQVLAGMIDDAEAERRQGKLCSFKLTKERMTHLHSVVRQRDRVKKDKKADEHFELGVVPDSPRAEELPQVKLTRTETLRIQAREKQEEEQRERRRSSLHQAGEIFAGLHRENDVKLTRTQELRQRALQRTVVHKMKKQQQSLDLLATLRDADLSQLLAEEDDVVEAAPKPRRRSVVVDAPSSPVPEDPSTSRRNSEAPTAWEQGPGTSRRASLTATAFLGKLKDPNESTVGGEDLLAHNLQRLQRLWLQVHEISRDTMNDEQKSEYHAKKAALGVVKTQVVRDLKKNRGRVRLDNPETRSLARAIFKTIINETDQAPGNVPMLSAFIKFVDLPYKDIIEDDDLIVGAAVDGSPTYLDMMLELEDHHGDIAFDAEGLLCAVCYHSSQRIPLMLNLLSRLANDERLTAAAETVPEAVQDAFEGIISERQAGVKENGRESRLRFRCLELLLDSKATRSSVDFAKERDDGLTIPGRAAAEGDFAAVEFLLRWREAVNGINFDVNRHSSQDGSTMLTSAVIGSSEAVVERLLLVPDLDVHGHDNDGMNAMDYAVKLQRSERIHTLLSQAGIKEGGSGSPTSLPAVSPRRKTMADSAEPPMVTFTFPTE